MNLNQLQRHTVPVQTSVQSKTDVRSEQGRQQITVVMIEVLGLLETLRLMSISRYDECHEVDPKQPIVVAPKFHKEVWSYVLLKWSWTG